MITVLALPYIHRLGFYSDDWVKLWQFHSGVILESYAHRPLQGLYLEGLFDLFGLEPLGHHLVNTAVLAASIPLFYVFLRRLEVDRQGAFAAAAILVVLPHLSTVRVWYAAFQIPLALLLALISLHAQLSFFRSGRWAWAAAAAIAAVASIASYETFAPALAVFPIALVIAARRRSTPSSHMRRIFAGLGALVIAVALAVIAKELATDRVRALDLDTYAKGLVRLVSPDYDWRTDSSLNLFAAAEVYFWHPFAGGARALGAAFDGRLGWLPIAAGVAVAALALWRLAAVPEAGGKRAPGRMILIGAAIFLLGHATFLLTPQIMFSSTGVANRMLVAAAPGTALILAGLVRLAVELPAGRRSWPYAAAIAVLCLVGSWRVEQIYAHWADARQIHAAAFSSASSDLDGVPTGSVVIVDGVCPYHGPAVVLESWWDSSGALSLALDRDVRGDTSSNRLRITESGLRTSMYGETGDYPFGDRLFAYQPYQHRLVPLPDRGSAVRYFAESRSRNSVCPESFPGQGVLM